MTGRRVRRDANPKTEERRETVVRNAASRQLKSRGVEALASAARREAAPRWLCLRSRIGVAVAPLRNLTDDIGQNGLGEVFTQDLISELVKYGRGFSVQRSSAGWRSSGPTDMSAEPEGRYLVTGSVQRGGSEPLRVNVQIADTETSEYLWAHRYEFDTQEPTPNKTKIIRRISRELHLLLLGQEISRASLDLDSEPDLDECLSSAATALEGELRPDLTAEAQRWYLAALADDPRNVEALVGLARTCQELVSNPWWGDPLAASVASDLGREVVAIALKIAPGAADAHCVQGMLHSAAGKLDDAAFAFERALAMDHGLAIAHGFAAYNAAFLGSAGDTLPAIERAMRLDPADRRHSIWFFFGGFAELLMGRTDASIALLRKSLERNSSYGSARMFLIAALSLSGRYREAVEAAALFRQQYPDGPAGACEQLWLSRSHSATYRAQILPVFDTMRSLGVVT
jgi:TolB-like protein/tetratricopeptide (TPR) repeat protein